MVPLSAVLENSTDGVVDPQPGALSAEQIHALIDSGALIGSGDIKQRIQPCSLDLTLGVELWRMPASVLPLAGEPVADVIAHYARSKVDLSTPQTLARGNVYMARIAECCALPAWLGGYTNNKSSIGRIDMQTRTLCDGSPRYDKIPRGYKGDLYLEITPRSFDVEVQAGSSLNQAIFYGRRQVLDTDALEALARNELLAFRRDGQALHADSLIIDGGLLLGVDLDQPLVGYVARNTTEAISLISGQVKDGSEFFEPIPRPRQGRLLLRRGHFYVFSTREFVRIPPEYAVEMLPHETSAGEFRAHYAGFFDPGFGWSPAGAGTGTPAVLEVRPYDDDIILRDGQPICKMAFERMAAKPAQPYGTRGVGSHYNEQRGPRLSRFLQ